MVKKLPTRFAEDPEEGRGVKGNSWHCIHYRIRIQVLAFFLTINKGGL
jgi:hypothetical protein